MAEEKEALVQGATYKVEGIYEPYKSFEAKVIGHDPETGVTALVIERDGSYERLTVHLDDNDWKVGDKVSGDHEDLDPTIADSAKTAPPR